MNQMEKSRRALPGRFRPRGADSGSRPLSLSQDDGRLPELLHLKMQDKRK
jgi:hypothetical protein